MPKGLSFSPSSRTSLCHVSVRTRSFRLQGTVYIAVHNSCAAGLAAAAGVIAGRPQIKNGRPRFYGAVAFRLFAGRVPARVVYREISHSFRVVREKLQGFCPNRWSEGEARSAQTSGQESVPLPTINIKSLESLRRQTRCWLKSTKLLSWILHILGKRN